MMPVREQIAAIKIAAAADAEIDRLRAENARLTADHAAAIALVADVRAAIGDNGQRMQPALIEYVLCLRADAERYRVIRDWPNRHCCDCGAIGPESRVRDIAPPRAPYSERDRAAAVAEWNRRT